ncbi:MAG: TetR/AcrR family transcriptional regulator [Pseudomonadota bacterium]
MTTGHKGGRPLSFDHDQALQAATELFWRRGYRAVSASELAEAMGLQRSSFYNSFGSREAVFREVLARYDAAAPDTALDLVAAGDPVLPRLRAMLREVCRLRAWDRQARGCLLCNSVAELAGTEPLLGPWLEAAVQARINRFARLIRQAVAQGEMRPPTDPKALARALAAFVIGLNTLSKTLRDERQLWVMCEAFLAGMGLDG